MSKIPKKSSPEPEVKPPVSNPDRVIVTNRSEASNRIDDSVTRYRDIIRAKKQSQEKQSS
jgi:hypothetical protein